MSIEQASGPIRWLLASPGYSATTAPCGISCHAGHCGPLVLKQDRLLGVSLATCCLGRVAPSKLLFPSDQSERKYQNFMIFFCQIYFLLLISATKDRGRLWVQGQSGLQADQIYISETLSQKKAYFLPESRILLGSCFQMLWGLYNSHIKHCVMLDLY